MIAIIQPFIPHYREDFFKGLKEKHKIDLYCYKNKAEMLLNNFEEGQVESKKIKSFTVGPVLIYNPFSLLQTKYKTLVLMLHYGHLSTWILLFTKPIHKKKIILWGQGISVKNYIKEQKKPNSLLKLMVKLSDIIWLYTIKEKEIWKEIFPKKSIISLNNTISDVGRIVNYKSETPKENLKETYNIKQEFCFIFCARFNNPYRRVDLLEEIIKQMDAVKYAFIIIGEGVFKPNFSNFTNVYEYGSVYDSKTKDDLFTVADFYIQPGWVGLSVVEALAYGKPVLTFERSKETLQCVEYAYLRHNYNAIICKNIGQFQTIVLALTKSNVQDMSLNAKEYIENNLLMSSMVLNAERTI